MGKRIIGAHLMNSESSRSHMCCTITLKQRGDPADLLTTVVGERRHSDSSRSFLSCKFHLVDLAGSEMVISRYTNVLVASKAS